MAFLQHKLMKHMPLYICIQVYKCTLKEIMELLFINNLRYISLCSNLIFPYSKEACIKTMNCIFFYKPLLSIVPSTTLLRCFKISRQCSSCLNFGHILFLWLFRNQLSLVIFHDINLSKRKKQGIDIIDLKRSNYKNNEWQVAHFKCLLKWNSEWIKKL